MDADQGALEAVAVARDPYRHERPATRRAILEAKAEIGEHAAQFAGFVLVTLLHGGEGELLVLLDVIERGGDTRKPGGDGDVFAAPAASGRRVVVEGGAAVAARGGAHGKILCIASAWPDCPGRSRIGKTAERSGARFQGGLAAQKILAFLLELLLV